MRFRIKENRKPYPGQRLLFTVERGVENWFFGSPFMDWDDYKRDEWPHESACFDTLEQARKFIAEEEEKFRLRELERKRTQPVYHKP